MSEKSFKFYVPVDLIKSEKEDEATEWRIQGIASTPDEDLQGETIDQNGLDISVIKAGHGLFNFDHQKGPENLLGEIEDAEFIDQDGKKVLMVKGYLFKHQERSKAFYNILKSLKKGSAKRVQMSIEGKILQRDFTNSKAIKKARIDKVALTLDPVNPYTYAELCKSLSSPDNSENQVVESTEELVTINKSDMEKILDFAKKALSAGIGGALSPSSRNDGEAMSKESLDSKVKPITHSKKKKLDKNMLKSLVNNCLDANEEADPLEVLQLLLTSINEKF